MYFKKFEQLGHYYVAHQAKTKKLRKQNSVGRVVTWRLSEVNGAFDGK